LIRVVADENFNNSILRGVLRSNVLVDAVRVQDVGLITASDPTILEWAAAEGRVLLTQDEKTMTGFAFDRVRQGLPMPGVVVVPATVPIGVAVEDLLLIIGASHPEELINRVINVPLKH